MDRLEPGDELELYFEREGVGGAIAVFSVISVFGDEAILRWTSILAMSFSQKHASIGKIIDSEHRLEANAITLGRDEILSRSRDNPETATKMDALFKTTRR